MNFQNILIIIYKRCNSKIINIIYCVITNILYKNDKLESTISTMFDIDAIS